MEAVAKLGRAGLSSTIYAKQSLQETHCVGGTFFEVPVFGSSATASMRRPCGLRRRAPRGDASGTGGCHHHHDATILAVRPAATNASCASAPPPHASHHRATPRTNAAWGHCGTPCTNGRVGATHASPMWPTTSCLHGAAITMRSCRLHHGAATTAYAPPMHPTALATRQRAAPPHAWPHHCTPPPMRGRGDAWRLSQH